MRIARHNRGDSLTKETISSIEEFVNLEEGREKCVTVSIILVAEKGTRKVTPSR
jgi:hypothetical protein